MGHVDDESSLEKTIDEIFIEEQKAVFEAKQNPNTINYLVGKVIQKTKGKANPSLILDIIQKKLESSR